MFDLPISMVYLHSFHDRNVDQLIQMGQEASIGLFANGTMCNVPDRSSSLQSENK
jgi:hypothetical protein